MNAPIDTPAPAPFHPAVADWFGATFAAPTRAQIQAWPAIQAGGHVLVAAPTGSGKTLTAFMAAIDSLVREGLEHGGALAVETRVIYVSPLKALSNDIQLNLEQPLAGIRAELERRGLPDVAIRTAVRTGDTPPSARTAMRKRPPQILVTTPESLYILLGSESGRAMLATARSVIVDEIHAIAGSKRGSHLALSLARLDALCGRPLQRIGLSATQKPIEWVAEFLVGADARLPLPLAPNSDLGSSLEMREGGGDLAPPLAQQGEAGRGSTALAAAPNAHRLDPSLLETRPLLNPPPLERSDGAPAFAPPLAQQGEAGRGSAALAAAPKAHPLGPSLLGELSSPPSSATATPPQSSPAAQGRRRTQKAGYLIEAGRRRTQGAGHLIEAGRRRWQEAGCLDEAGRRRTLEAHPLTEARCERDEPVISLQRAASATPGKPGDRAACTIINMGHSRPRDLALVVPPVPLEAVMSNESWATVYDQLATLAQHHRTTLVFVNTRRMAERVARQLSERLGKDHVSAHHGSLAKEQRLLAEQRLKRGELRVLVATASLELGIDIGDIDLVCQLGSPRSIAAFLQRAGRSGHAVTGTPKARLFPATRDDLVECTALLDCVRRGELDALVIPPQPLDVLAQQIVAEVASRDWDEDALFALVRRAYPYRALSRDDFDAVVRMLTEGFHSSRGQRGAYVHRDAVHRQLRARRGARMTAVTSGGAIPDNADYQVVMEPQATVIGSVHEDFAVESMAGDIFALGNTSYRVLRVEQGKLRVEDAHGVPPSIPFWLGEAPGRSDELSASVSRLREQIDALLDEGGPAAALHWLAETLQLNDPAAQQLVEYLHAARTALGVMPTQRVVVLERFFDASGATQLVIHSPWGSRINRAWGLALRKRFCRQFNFELQAAATENAIVLSLSTSHSFALEEVARYLTTRTAEDVLTQALLDAPLFAARWRWNATTALALPRFLGGKKAAPQLQRMRSEDLLAGVFPDQIACLENIAGPRRIPDHPLVAQTLHDCLREAMDLDGLLQILHGLESGVIAVIARDLTQPSPLASEVLTAAPYAFLDGAPLEERRTQAATTHRSADLHREDLGQLDPEAIAAVQGEAWPRVRSVDEMHEALDGLGFVSVDEVAANGWTDFVKMLAASRQATLVRLAGPGAPLSPALSRAEQGRGGGSALSVLSSSSAGDSNIASCARESMAIARAASPPDRAELPPLPQTASPFGGEGWGEGDALAHQQSAIWTSAEKLPLWQALHPTAPVHPPITAPADHLRDWPPEDALRGLIRARLLGLGPVTTDTLAVSLHVPANDVRAALLALQTEGHVMLGTFTPNAVEEEACERHLLARIHRYTVGRRRRDIEPVSRRDLMRFLFEWQHLTPATRRRGPDALTATLAQLEGFEAAAGAWETELLPARIDDYAIHWLDDLCRAGRIGWSRLRPGGSGGGPVRATPIVLLPRRQLGVWTSVAERDAAEPPTLSSRAQAVADALRGEGALFFDELTSITHLLRTELEGALSELVAAGRITADSFAGLRTLVMPAAKRNSSRHRRMRRHSFGGIEDAGRWALVRASAAREDDAADAHSGADAQRREQTEHVARALLQRYGVVFWKLLEREAGWLPSWRELRQVYQRLEARGEIRGGRFVDGLVGEQFALPEAIPALREIQRREAEGEQVVISGCDPLNLVGTVLVDERVPAVMGSRVLFEDGVAVATKVGGKVQLLIDGDAKQQQRWRVALSAKGSSSRAWACGLQAESTARSC